MYTRIRAIERKAECMFIPARDQAGKLGPVIEGCISAFALWVEVVKTSKGKAADCWVTCVGRGEVEKGFSFLERFVMADAAAGRVKKSRAVEQDSERIARLKERLERTLREAAEIEVELSRVDGTIRGVSHYSVIEGRPHELGKQLSQTVQQQMSELAADLEATAKCPTCGARCPVDTTRRRLQSVDGVAYVTESRGYCLGCRRAFFPFP